MNTKQRIDDVLARHASALWDAMDGDRLAARVAPYGAPLDRLSLGRLVRPPAGAGGVVVYVNNVTPYAYVARIVEGTPCQFPIALESEARLRRYIPSAPEGILADIAAALPTWRSTVYDEISASDFQKMSRRATDAPPGYFRH